MHGHFRTCMLDTCSFEWRDVRFTLQVIASSFRRPGKFRFVMMFLELATTEG